MSVLVTGGAGYVGSHVVAALLDAGRDVVIADDFRLGARDAIDRIASATQGRRPRVVEVDVTNEARLVRALAAEPVDAVVHVASLLPAAAASVRRATGAVPFVFSSSARVYGVPWRCPVGEHDACAR
jgi:UDP-glucose 4-epimerase